MGSTPTSDTYDVIFEPECLNKLERFAPLEAMDRALSDVKRNLQKNPYVYPSLPEYPNWRVAITLRHKTERRVIPGLRLYFVIKEVRKLVRVVDVVIDLDAPGLFM